MKFSFISLFPELLDQGMQTGILQQALKKGIIDYDITNPREFTQDRHKSVDDRPYGGGDGMLMMTGPLSQAVEKCLAQVAEESLVVSTSPHGKVLNHSLAVELAQKKSLVILCGRYAGIDQRLTNLYVDMELSIGDYVISGGELAALVLTDSVSRQIPGVLGNPQSKEVDSFSAGLLEAPQFTRPEEFHGQKVPSFLLSGDHQKIANLRRALSVVLTQQKRPDLDVDPEELARAKKELSELSAEELQVCGVEPL